MTDLPPNAKKVRGSSSAFMLGDKVVTRYSSGCLRHILLQSHGLRDTLDPKHIERGALNEERFLQRLTNDPTYLGTTGKFDREKVLTSPINGFDDTFFAGRCDYYLYDLPGTPTRLVEELKSTESSSVLSQVIRQGHYKLENLAQLIAYMTELQCVDGRLRYTYYKRDKKTQVLTESAERVFIVHIEDSGAILVDGEPSDVSVQDQLKHRQASAVAINNTDVPVRPIGWDAGWESPCKFCQFASACDSYDIFGGDQSSFINSCRPLANKEVP